ncbi:MAG: hypothetical protein ISS48_00620 [Candidatus Aenigmarchaeota archaeon]|nr:hypothetical protein [Candidatus Aenigmarchaeota archaeon]
MRSQGKNDNEIISFLGLKSKKPFRMDRKYLKSLFGFVTSRKSDQGWINYGLRYGYRTLKPEKPERKTTRSLGEFIKTKRNNQIR